MVCPHCGHSSVAPRLPVLVVTGAAASGKSTIGAALAELPDLLALDGDVLASGAAAVSGGRRDYPAFWRYLLHVAEEVHNNGLVPAYCCICLPDQVLGTPAVRGFSGVHFLALVCGEDELRRRILTRVGTDTSPANIDFHLAFNRELSHVTVEAPHSLTIVDTTGRTARQTVDVACRWAADELVPLAADANG
jgi:hypothetical protein